MTVCDNVAFGLTRAASGRRPRSGERVDELLELVQLEGFGEALPGAALRRPAPAHGARARARGRAGVLLLDEPFGALDARVRKELRDWLRRLHDEMHVTTVFVTHDQEEAMDVADQIVLMNHGRVEQVGDRASCTSTRRTSSSWASSARSTGSATTLRAPARHRARSSSRTGDSTEAMVERVVHLGFEVRVELVRGDGEQLCGADHAATRREQLELERGQIVYVRARLRRAPVSVRCRATSARAQASGSRTSSSTAAGSSPRATSASVTSSSTRAGWRGGRSRRPCRRSAEPL